MPNKTKPWTPERRKRQAEHCKKHKPWEKSTGPKTKQGKQDSSRNSLKHGKRSTAYTNLRKALTAQARFLKELNQAIGLKL